jgi:hypothetical protein
LSSQVEDEIRIGISKNLIGSLSIPNVYAVIGSQKLFDMTDLKKRFLLRVKRKTMYLMPPRGQ